ncbi:MAG: ABC transporter ATP-binding protein [Lachnospiraceae bacterium]|nr:ABC transporter ATP-binding protein [Lachnospiraceae bacterium]
MDSMKWAAQWMGRHRWKLITSIVLNIFGVVLMTYEPYIFKDIVDDVLMPMHFELLIPMLVKAFIVGVAFVTIRYFVSILAEQASQEAVRSIKSALFHKLLGQTSEFYRENTGGDLINKCSGDVEMIAHFLNWILPHSIECLFMLVAALAIFMSINWQYTLILLAVTPFTAVVARKLSKTVRPAFRAAREQLSELNTVVQENIGGNRVVKAFVREDYEMGKFQKENQKYKDLNIKATFLWLKYGPIIESISSLLTVINLTVGGILVCTGSITLGELTLFLSLAWALNEPMNMMGMIVNSTQRFYASVEKIQDLYYSSIAIESPEKDKSPETVQGEIELQDVSLRYGNTPVLDHVSLHLAPGETVGIMGPTGSGKTTLINLIARYVDVSEGKVMVDGVDVRDYNLQKLRKSIGMTMQDVFLFSDTLESNIAYGVPDAPMETVLQAAKAADVSSFVDDMAEGYDTIIGERGTGLSGGQKQRISLARALAVETPILILDDTTSAVDMETEQYIQEQLRELPKKATTIIIAQRVSSVMHADKIVILDKGRIVEQGTHWELMQNPKGYYYKTCVLQHGGLENGGAA